MRDEALRIALTVLKQPGIPPTLREAAVSLSDAARNRGNVIVKQRLDEVRKLLDEFQQAREAEISENATERASVYGRLA